MKKEVFTPDFILIPKPLLLCKDLTWSDRATYGAVYWFHNLKDGRCFASNSGIASVIGLNTGTVKNSLTRLEKYGFIVRSFDEEGSREFITPLVRFNDTPSLVSDAPRHQLMTPPSLVDAHIHNIDTEYNINNISLPINGKNSIDRVYNFYSLVFRHFYGFVPKHTNYPKEARGIKSLLKHYNELQFGMFILLHFEWKGASGNDEFTFRRLSDNCFPISWIAKNTNAYEAYFKNTLDIDINNSEELLKQLQDKIKEYD